MDTYNYKITYFIKYTCTYRQNKKLNSFFKSDFQNDIANNFWKIKHSELNHVHFTIRCICNVQL